MPFNGSGTFTRLYNWTSDASNGIPISASRFDGEDNDFASGLSNCLTRDGQGGPLTAITWQQALTLNSGTDGTNLTIGRTGGTNNPALQVQVADASGITLNTNIATALKLAISGTTALSISSTGVVGIAAPTAGVALNVTGIAGQAIANFTSGNTGTAGDLVVYRTTAGTANSLAQGPNIQLGAGSGSIGSTLLQNSGGQSEIWQANSGSWQQLAYWNTNRGLNLNAPASGNALSISGVAGSSVAVLGGGGNGTTAQAELLISRAGSTSNTVGHGPNIQLSDTVTGYASTLQNSGGQTELWQYGSNWQQLAYWNGNRGFVLNAPASGAALTINGVAATTQAQINSANTTGSDLLISRSGTGTSNTYEAGSNIALASGANSTVIQNSGGQTEIYQNGVQAAYWSSNRNFVINAPTTGSALTINGGTGGNASGTYGGAFSATINGGTQQVGFFSSSAGGASGPYMFGTGSSLNTGTTTPALTANKPGSTTTILGWIAVSVNGTLGWMPVWNN